MTDFVLRLAEDNSNLNEKVRVGIKGNFDVIRTTSTPYGEFGKLIYHLFDAVNLWLNRITANEENILTYVELNDIDMFFAEWIKVDKRFLKYAKQNAGKLDYDKKISYNHKNGEIDENSLRDLLLHISTHSFYHRGQIATLLRINNFDPLKWF